MGAPLIRAEPALEPPLLLFPPFPRSLSFMLLLLRLLLLVLLLELSADRPSGQHNSSNTSTNPPTFPPPSGAPVVNPWRDMEPRRQGEADGSGDLLCWSTTDATVCERRKHATSAYDMTGGEGHWG